MIKLFQNQPSPAWPGPSVTYLVANDRPDLLKVLGWMAQKPAAARVCYYDPMGRGAVDLLIEIEGSGADFSAKVSKPDYRGGWCPSDEYTLPAATAFVKRIFSDRPAPGSGQGSEDPADPTPSSAAPVKAPPKARSGQMALF